MCRFKQLNNVGTRILVAFALALAFAGALFAAKPASADVWNPVKIGVYATDAVTHAPISGATVTVKDQYGNIVAEGMTQNGFWTTITRPGTYKITVTDYAYYPYGTIVSLSGGQTTVVDAPMQTVIRRYAPVPSDNVALPAPTN